MTTPHIKSRFVPSDGSDPPPSNQNPPPPPVPVRLAERFMAKAMSLLKISSSSSIEVLVADDEEDDGADGGAGGGGGLETTQWMKLPSTTFSSTNRPASSSFPAAISRTRFSGGMFNCRLTAAFKSSTVAEAGTVTDTSPMSELFTLTSMVAPPPLLLLLGGAPASNGTASPSLSSPFFPTSNGNITPVLAVPPAEHRGNFERVPRAARSSSQR